MTSSYELRAVLRLMREQPGVADRANAAALTVSGGAIDFKGVTFTYPGKQEPVFDNLSLSIKPRERIALIGHSGSGKTSFVRLVQRLYDVQQGSISIDGRTSRRHDPAFAAQPDRDRTARPGAVSSLP